MSIRNRLGVVFGLLSMKLLEPTVREAAKETSDEELLGFFRQSDDEWDADLQSLTKRGVLKALFR